MSDPQHARLRQKLHVSMTWDPADLGKNMDFGGLQIHGSPQEGIYIYMTKAGSGVDFPKRGPYLFKGSYTFIVYYISYTYTVSTYILYLCTYIYIHTHFGRSRFFPFFWFFQSKSLEFDPLSKSALCQPLAWYVE